MKTPIALIIFNRPDTTERVFQAIRQARPTRLFVIADGPREDRPGEAELCRQTRAIIDQVDWDCEVMKDYAEENLGCRKRPATGLDWVFEQVEEVIILEDDCLPHPSFFPYCEALLDHYRHDTRIMHINGNNFGVSQHHIHPHSYSFCRFPQVWGWATWRRAWTHFDGDLTLWPTFRDGGFVNSLHTGRLHRKHQIYHWDQIHAGLIDTWDFQWHFAVMSQHGLAVAPTTNLISNIGFSDDATHTKDPWSAKANAQTQAMTFPLRHPPFVCNHPKVDAIYAAHMLDDSLWHRGLRKMRRMLGRTRRT